MSFAENLANVVNRYDEISSLLSSPDVTPENLVKMNKELAELGPVVEAVNHYRKAEKDLNDAKAMMEDAGMDREMREMAEAEYYELKEKLPELERKLKSCCCRKTRKTRKTPFWKCAPVPAATRPLCLPRFCSRCTSVMRRNRGGVLKFLMLTKTVWAVIRRLRPKLPARMFFQTEV